jgi:hypothetical protein
MRWSDFPYAVEIAVTKRGLGGKRDAMHDFHARLGITPHRGRWKNEDGRRYMRWRFASLTTAQKFARQFGGSLVTGR